MNLHGCIQYNFRESDNIRIYYIVLRSSFLSKVNVSLLENIDTELDIMEEKPVVASMSNEVILSIEDLQREGSKKLPSFKRGRPSLPCLLTLFKTPSCQPILENSNNPNRILQLRFHRPNNRTRELHRLPEIPSPLSSSPRCLKSRHQHGRSGKKDFLPSLRLSSWYPSHGSSRRRASN